MIRKFARLNDFAEQGNRYPHLVVEVNRISHLLHVGRDFDIPGCHLDRFLPGLKVLFSDRDGVLTRSYLAGKRGFPDVATIDEYVRSCRIRPKVDHGFLYCFIPGLRC